MVTLKNILSKFSFILYPRQIFGQSMYTHDDVEPRLTSTTTQFMARHRKVSRQEREANAFNDILRERTTYQEMLDEGFNLHERSTNDNNDNNETSTMDEEKDGEDRESSATPSQSDCSDDDGGCTKNSILLDKKIISMFLNTRPSTLDVICRFMFPFCYLGFVVYWWLHYLDKRDAYHNDFCRDLYNIDYVNVINCKKYLW